ncbi:MAG TPA: hypothetical protein VE135_19150 [Pyrinomonadaceae bacterium]|nr:hypothetical protein [Pyrinomonadaceae bacterium]
MREEILKQFFTGDVTAKILARDLVGSLITNGDMTKHPIEDMSENVRLLPKHLISLCDAVLDGEIKPKYLHAVGFCFIASDNFEYDTDASEGELIAETVSDWSAPMVHYPLTPKNVEKFRHRLATG